MPPPLEEFRCFAEAERLSPGPWRLDENESRHLAQVRRATPGTCVRVLNGRGFVASAVLQRVDKKGVELEIGEVREVPAPSPHITLAMAGLKQSAWDEVLRHAVELGINQLLWVSTRHGVAEVEPLRAEGKLARWRDRMVQACKQSANPWLPGTGIAGSVGEALRLCPPGALHLLASIKHAPRQALSSLLRDTPGTPRVLWIGPEGDFTPDEENTLLVAGAHPVSLGPRILRAETAALALAAHLRLSESP